MTRGNELSAVPATFQLGGQALIEGVMMRSPHFVAAAVRLSDGSVSSRLEAVDSVLKRHPLLALPLVRGVVAMVEMLSLGMRYLNWSSQMALADPAQPGDEPAEENAPVSAGLPWWAFVLTLLGSMALGLMAFVALPNWLADHTAGRLTHNVVALNLAEGLIKLAIFIAYLWLIGRRPDIVRVFEYHGAEHKVVYAAENQRPLTPDGARPFDTPHPRCGTGFALTVVLVSVLCFALLPWTRAYLPRVLMRLALMPLVAGVSYEILKLVSNPRWGTLAAWVLRPGMWLQRLTTRQPDDQQLEVACVAMRAVVAAEAGLPLTSPGLTVTPVASLAGVRPA